MVVFKNNKEIEFENLLWEISQEENVLSCGYKTYLPSYKNLDQVELRKQFDRDYDIGVYQKARDFLSEKWAKVESDFFKEVSKITHQKPLDKYIVHITLFGPGGSYKPPQEVTIRMVTEDDFDFGLTNIAHEIIHLMVDEKVIKMKLDQKSKEEFVNSILYQPSLADIFSLDPKKFQNSKFYKNLDKYF